MDLLVISTLSLLFATIYTFMLLKKVERYRNELKVLKESHDELEGISNIGTWFRNLEYKELHWSSHTYKIFGLNPKKKINAETFYDAVLPEYRDQLKEITAKTINSNCPYDIIYKIRRSDGKIRTLHNKAKIYFDTSGRPYKMLGTCTDITEERDGLVEKIHQAKLATLGQLAAGVAHEINNPLTVLFATSKKLLKIQNQEVTPEKYEKYYNIQKRCLTRIAKIVTGLRTYSRIDEGDYERFNINSAIKESFELVEEIFKKEGVSIELDLSCEDAFTYGSTGGLQQAIINLLYNSKDAFSQDSNDHIIKVQTVKNANGTSVFVSDNGSGINQSDQNRVFDSFYTTKAAGKGTGLGLPISKSILQDMDADLSLLRSSHLGTTFKIDLSETSSHLVQ
jgi:PAS domain S-box-containing protein